LCRIIIIIIIIVAYLRIAANRLRTRVDLEEFLSWKQHTHTHVVNIIWLFLPFFIIIIYPRVVMTCTLFERSAHPLVYVQYNCQRERFVVTLRSLWLSQRDQKTSRTYMCVYKGTHRIVVLACRSTGEIRKRVLFNDV